MPILFLISRDGRAGTGGDVAPPESGPARGGGGERVPSPSTPIRTRASRGESSIGAPARMARCTASRCVGEGGRGAGFIACAMVSGMVGTLADEMTGPTFQMISIISVYSVRVNARV